MNTINNNRMQRIFFILLFENIFLTFDIIHSEDGLTKNWNVGIFIIYKKIPPLNILFFCYLVYFHFSHILSLFQNN